MLPPCRSAHGCRFPLLFALLLVGLALGALSLFSCAPSNLPLPPGNSPDINEMYRIGRGDVLRIITWKEPDFTTETAVRLDGRISFPLLPDVEAAGRTSAEIRDEIQEKLAAYVSYPVVSVVVASTAGNRYYLLGEVQKPGEFPLQKPLTLLQALSLSGGFTEWADRASIILIRQQDGKQIRLQISYPDIVDGISLDMNLALQADDIIVVP